MDAVHQMRARSPAEPRDREGGIFGLVGAGVALVSLGLAPPWPAADASEAAIRGFAQFRHRPRCWRQWFRDVELGRGERIRTSDILLPKSETEITTRGNSSQPIGIISDFSSPDSNGLQQKAAICKDFAPILLPKKSLSLAARAGGHERLLSVAEVARRLGVCGATVYKLCARGHLDHVRVLNAIRVPPAVLDQFIGSRPSRNPRGLSSKSLR